MMDAYQRAPSSLPVSLLCSLHSLSPPSILPSIHPSVRSSLPPSAPWIASPIRRSVSLSISLSPSVPHSLCPSHSSLLPLPPPPHPTLQEWNRTGIRCHGPLCPSFGGCQSPSATSARVQACWSEELHDPIEEAKPPIFGCPALIGGTDDLWASSKPNLSCVHQEDSWKAFQTSFQASGLFPCTLD